jgi:hypothetical protein
MMARRAEVKHPATPRAAAEVIRGIDLDVPGRELVVRIGERIRWHRQRADVLIEQLKKLSDVEQNAADDLANILGRYESPRAILEKRLRHHQERATVLAFIRDHVATGAVYRLSAADLRMIDVLPDR